MKIHFFVEFHKGPWGGGNQFLKALKKHFIKLNLFENNIELADIILFNSHHLARKLINLKKKYKNKIFVHRVDGPMSLYTAKKDKRDLQVKYLNKYIADGTIFQSKWSKKENEKLGFKGTDFFEIILNASDPSIFFCNKEKNNKRKNKKTSIICTSWSSNLKKGFEIYEFLDRKLNFDKFEMTFVGNSDIKFKNIKQKKPLNSVELANELRKHDIFLTGSQKDPCSNALTEALSCGLPSIALNDGGHPEIIKEGGLLFNNTDDILEIIETMVLNLHKFKENINFSNIEYTAKQYMNFFEKLSKSVYLGDHKLKQLNLINQIKLMINL